MPRMPVLAHPLTQPDELPEYTFLIATVAMCLVAGAGHLLAARARRRSHVQPPGTVKDTDPAADAVPQGRARIAFVLMRFIGLALLVLAIVAGRFGSDEQLENITPALIIGAGWPLLVLASAVFGRIWWWIDPFDTLARGVAPLGAGDGPADNGDGRTVIWAAAPAALWVAYLTVWPNSLAPGSVSNAALTYTVVTLAGCLAIGRRQWLARGEIFGIFLGWIARLRREWAHWTPAGGSAAVLGVLAGGLLYGLVRDSLLVSVFSYGSPLKLFTVVAAFAGVSALLAARAEHRQQIRTGVRAVALAMVPATAALAFALGLARNRFTTSLQLLPQLASDPLGTQPDLLGPAINSQPLGHEGLLALQVGLLLVGHLVGVAAVARRVATAETSTTPILTIIPAVTMLAILLGVSVAAVAATAGA